MAIAEAVAGHYMAHNDEHDENRALCELMTLISYGTFLDDERLNESYRVFREAIMNDPDYRGFVPKLLERHESRKELWEEAAAIWGPHSNPSQEKVAGWIYSEMSVLYHRESQLFEQRNEGTKSLVDSALWTGIQSPAQRVITIRSTLPIALNAIDVLIDHLSQPPHNNGPRMDHIDEALATLRSLRDALDTILRAAEEGGLEAIDAQGLPAEAVQFAKRAWRLTRNDPLPLAVSGILFALFSTAGFPGAGAFAASIALHYRKEQTR
ncbi:hypothetical protein [Altererythrobacter sp. GH1-8]|uniref:hypothetical protein n=1 Tax=Altererythrobacter sp. GH1-8 TaxID=3349333 RepID=UPI00374DD13A